MSIGGHVHELRQALRELSVQFAELPLPLELPGVEEDRRAAALLADQIRDYILPRMAKPRAPLLAVVSGPAGVGKSTLVNTLCGTVANPPTVLRSGNREPVLVHHPRDERWFAGRGVGAFLPELPRTTGEERKPGALRLVSAPAAPLGLALLDTPDLGSSDHEQNKPASQLLTAADLCVYVMSAVRYADATCWNFLQDLAERGAAVAVVLNRVPEKSQEELRREVVDRLAVAGLPESPVFVVCETAPGAHGMLPAGVVEELKNWVFALPSDTELRDAVVGKTLRGAVRNLLGSSERLAQSVERQVAEVERLRQAARRAYEEAVEEVDKARNGGLMRGEALARWREFVDSGEILHSLKVRMHRIRGELPADAQRRRRPGRQLSLALTHSLEVAIANAADRAAQQTEAFWRASEVGNILLGDEQVLGASSPDLLRRSGATIASWQSYLRRLVSKSNSDKENPRYLSFGPYGLGLVLMAMTVSSEEEGAGGLPEQVLRAVYGPAPARSLVRQAGRELRSRVADLMAEECARYEQVLDDLGLSEETAQRLRATSAIVEAGWSW